MAVSTSGWSNRDTKAMRRSAATLITLAALVAETSAFCPPTAPYLRPHSFGISLANSEKGGLHRTQIAARKRGTLSLNMIDVGTILFNLDQLADSLVTNQLQHLSPASAVVVYGAGILTSLSPCALSVLPLTVGYIGGSQGKGESALLPSIAFSLGLASVLSIFGLLASFFGQVYGTLGGGPLSNILPLATSSLFIYMGLTMLDILPLPAIAAPSVAIDATDDGGFGRLARAYAFGASSALVSSPCATPVLASLLGFAANVHDPVLGGALLLAYTTGYCTPLMVAGVASGSLSQLSGLKGAFAWVTPACGSLLICAGTYSALARLFPA